ncbi:signal transduction histidine kinase/DNA-binding response OmpR family regulator/ligand-binding sensor domain-containing protein [Lewinella aquimaris]|uniref:histidine kinase n=1 Tax=Neolewinella aquimaris TaxID=1835722 RepID=A0A840EEP3_9BACT|nr:hybrid sensor histidine kinase/response regulator transcription factor [Neolewinella aquimaris]MBB4080408.1 signal transduction histidine kinase/DNA-binding response OmpR family regulator/ligand-binding sensor domain-containing protein [Neolewinella aquimaris]
MCRLILLLSILSGTLIGQSASTPPYFGFERFDMPGNVPSRHIQTVTQDSFGFMWFGSQNGLHRWDGYQFRTYRHAPDRAGSLPNNYVEYLYVTRNGELWIGTGGGGLARFDYGTEHFVSFRYLEKDPATLSNDFVSKIDEDHAGNLWVATGNGVNILDRETGRFQRFLPDPADSTSLSYQICRDLHVDARGTVWIATGPFWETDDAGGLNRYRPATNDFVRYLHDPNDRNSLLSNKVAMVTEDSRGRLWVGTKGNGLHLLDPQTDRFTRTRDDAPGSPLSAPYLKDTRLLHTSFLHEDREGKFWIGVWDGGLKYYDPETGFTRTFRFEAGVDNGFTENGWWNMYESRDGSRWVWTADEASAVYRVTVKQSVFDHYAFTDPQDAALSFLDDENGAVLIGTQRSGLRKLAHDKLLAEPVVPLNGITKIVSDRQGGYWLLSDAPNRLSHWDSRNDRVTHPDVPHDHISDILLDADDQLWALTPLSHQLHVYDARQSKFIAYDYLTSETEGVSPTKNALMTLDGEGDIWLVGGVRKGGETIVHYVRYDPARRSPYAAGTPNLRGFVGRPAKEMEGGDPNHVYSVEAGECACIWICTTSSVKRLSVQTNNFATHLIPNKDLPYFAGLQEAGPTGTWLLTDRLVNFDAATGNQKFFPLGAGLRPFHGQRSTLYRAENGRLFFGVNGGFHRFDPATLEEHTAKERGPEVALLNFKLPYIAGDESANDGPNAPVYTLDNVELSAGQSAFDLSFFATDFSNPAGNKYQFQLEGYDNGWRTAGEEHRASYVKVPPGDYLFRVRAATANSDWGPETVLPVYLAAPWWASPWAYAGYAALLAGLLYALYWFQLNRRLAVAESARLKELDTVKSELYTNITHEFRTPLTVIMGLADQLRERGCNGDWSTAAQSLTVIERNGRQLLRSVNEMLDLAKLESGHLELAPVHADVISFVKYLCESFESHAAERGVELIVYTETDELLMDYDPQALTVIVSNLLSNAIKFSAAGESVFLHLKHAMAGTQEQCFLRVKDAGRGIDPADLPYIFDRFYQAGNEGIHKGEGTGIGLALTREMVTYLGGTIEVESTPERGSAFTVLLPVTRTACSKDIAPASPPKHTIAVPERTFIVADTATDRPLALVVEDNHDVAHYLRECLESKYAIVHATDGGAGETIAYDRLPDIVISDVMMPVKDGFALCEALKNDARTDHIPVILLTGRATERDRLRGLGVGADAYLAKPFSRAELFTRIDQLLRLRKKLIRRVDTDPFKHFLRATGTAPETKFLQRTIRIILDDLDNADINALYLARKLHMSESQLYRKLKAITGKSTAIFIRSIRLQRAKELLHTTELSVSEIGYAVGFRDASWFSRAFKTEFGFAPSGVREAAARELH